MEADGRGEDTIITVGVGQHQICGAAQFYKFKHPRMFLSSSGSGTMGFGLPAAVGAKAANPNKLVVDIDGDGSFLMNIQELATAYCEKLPGESVAVEQSALGYGDAVGRSVPSREPYMYLGPIDHPEAIGQGNGLGPSTLPGFCVDRERIWSCGAANVKKKSDLNAVLKEMIEYPGPFVLDVEVPYQEHVLPMIPAGMTVKDLIKE